WGDGDDRRTGCEVPAVRRRGAGWGGVRGVRPPAAVRAGARPLDCARAPAEPRARTGRPGAALPRPEPALPPGLLPAARARRAGDQPGELGGGQRGLPDAPGAGQPGRIPARAGGHGARIGRAGTPAGGPVRGDHGAAGGPPGAGGGRDRCLRGAAGAPGGGPERAGGAATSHRRGAPGHLSPVGRGRGRGAAAAAGRDAGHPGHPGVPEDDSPGPRRDPGSRRRKGGVMDVQIKPTPQAPVGADGTAGEPVELIVGIDLGTTNSLVAYMDRGVPRIILDEEGAGLLPSVVAFGLTGPVVGRAAKRQLVRRAERAVYSVKRFMGKGYDDVKDE